MHEAFVDIFSQIYNSCFPLERPNRRLLTSIQSPRFPVHFKNPSKPKTNFTNVFCGDPVHERMKGINRIKTDWLNYCELLNKNIMKPKLKRLVMMSNKRGNYLMRLSTNVSQSINLPLGLSTTIPRLQIPPKLRTNFVATLPALAKAWLNKYLCHRYPLNPFYEVTIMNLNNERRDN